MAEVERIFDLLRGWLSIPINVTMLATAVIAIGTLVNVCVSYRMTRAVKDSADASKTVADVTRATFDAAHRPYFAISQVELENFEAEDDARIRVVTKNYGKVPLRMTDYNIRAIVADEDRPEEPPVANRFLPAGSGVVLPNDEATFHCGLAESWLHNVLARADVELSVIADFTYVPLGSDGEYRSQSKHKYNPELGVFETIGSKMT